jgi:cell wall-associated NlpC family hydrolase
VLAFGLKELGRPYAGPLSDYPLSDRFDGPGPHDGFDCSSFVSMMNRRALGVVLTAYTDAIHDQTDPLAASDVLPGDIVLWQYNDGVQSATFPHVGLVYSADRRQVLDCRYPMGVGVHPTLNATAVYRRVRGIKAS